jgi:phosphate:Na+ symporter
MDTNSLPLADILMGLGGGIALFLFGMEQMTDGLKAVAGDGMRTLLATLTKNRVAGAFTGAIVTAVIQSSSVTTVLVVGFVSAGLMSLTQSVGVIMGSNVGTTITAQIVAFKITKYAAVPIFIGFAMIFSGKKAKIRHWGGMVMGLGLIFFGMGLMSDATSPLRSYQPFIDLMTRMANPLLGILVAAVFTAIVQSSSATTGIVIVLASQGFISLEAGIALAFGANIGTCVTALLATLGKPRIAMQAAMVHVIFNVAGVLLWLPFIDALGGGVRAMSPAYLDLEGMQRLAAETPRQIANAHTLFNIANTILLLPAAGLIARLATLLIKERPEVLPERATPIYLDSAFLRTPALTIDPLRKELGRLAGHVSEFGDRVVEAAQADADFEQVAKEHRNIGLLYDGLVAYLGRVSEEEIDDTLARRLRALGAVATNTEHVAEIFSTNVVQLASQRKAQELPTDPEAQQIIQELLAVTRGAFGDAMTALDEESAPKARAVIDLKPKVQALADDCIARLYRRISADDPKSLSAFRLHSQVVELLQRYFYFSKKIAKEIVAEVEQARPEDADVAAKLAS